MFAFNSNEVTVYLSHNSAIQESEFDAELIAKQLVVRQSLVHFMKMTREPVVEFTAGYNPGDIVRIVNPDGSSVGATMGCYIFVDGQFHSHFRCYHAVT